MWRDEEMVHRIAIQCPVTFEDPEDCMRQNGFVFKVRDLQEITLWEEEDVHDAEENLV